MRLTRVNPESGQRALWRTAATQSVGPPTLAKGHFALANGHVHRSLGHRPRNLVTRFQFWLKAKFTRQNALGCRWVCVKNVLGYRWGLVLPKCICTASWVKWQNIRAISIPYIFFIKHNSVPSQKFAKLFLKRLFAMMLFLITNVIFYFGFVCRAN